jgi:hypothetical protein
MRAGMMIRHGMFLDVRDFLKRFVGQSKSKSKAKQKQKQKQSKAKAKA